MPNRLGSESYVDHFKQEDYVKSNHFSISKNLREKQKATHY